MRLHQFWFALFYPHNCRFLSKCYFLGGGQYGDVYEGEWKSYKKVVAVKTLKVFQSFSIKDTLYTANWSLHVATELYLVIIELVNL